MINPRDVFEGVSFDIEKDGFDNVILKMAKILDLIDPDRGGRIRESYSDVFNNIEFASAENKDYLFADLESALDLSMPPGWVFGPDEEFSVVYLFQREFE